MQSQISLTSVLAAVMLFVIAVLMHEAARADGDQDRYDLGWPGTKPIVLQHKAAQG